MKDNHEFDELFSFFLETDSFKDVEREMDRDGSGDRENNAEHTWHCCLIALVLHNKLTVSVDLGHALKLLVVHDLPEIYAGDVSAFDTQSRKGKSDRERAAAEKIFAFLGTKNSSALKDLWEEYEAEESSEALFAKSVDVIQARTQHCANDGATLHRLKITEEMIRNHKKDVLSFDPFIKAYTDYLTEVMKKKNFFYSADA